MTSQPALKAKITKIEIEKNLDILGDAYGNEWKVTVTRQDQTTETTYRNSIPHEGDPRMQGYYYAGYKAGRMVWKARF